MSTEQRAEYVKGLRALADLLETPDAPLSSAPSLRFCVDSGAEVHEFAAILGSAVQIKRGGHVRTTRTLHGLTVEAFHVPPAAMREYEDRNSYSANVQVAS